MPTTEINAPGPAPVEPRAKTLALQGFVNRIMRGLLRTPLLGRLVGKRLITLYVVGRKSGRRYAIPVAYTQHGDALLVGTPFAWGKNLRTGDLVDLQLRGRRRNAAVEVVTDEPGVVALYGVMCRANRNFAKFNRIGISADGTPDPADLHDAWTAGARAIKLTPR